MDDSKKYKKKRSIEYMKKNMKNRTEESVYELPIKGICVLSELVKKQNLKLLEKIAEDKFELDDDKETFINKYFKINYYTPEVNKLHKEKLQKYI